MTIRCQSCHTTFESENDATEEQDIICPNCGVIVDVDYEED